MRTRVRTRTRSRTLAVAAAAACSLLGTLPGSATAAITLDASGCAGTALAMPSALGATPTLSASDCTVSFGNDSGSVQLRTSQVDGAGTAMTGFNDFTPATHDWDQGAELFGACLRSISGAPTSAWVRPGDGTCDALEGDPWMPIPATSGVAGALVAHMPLGTYTANLRFGARATAITPAGSYTAPVVIEVIQPAPAPPTNTTLPAISGTTTTGQTLTTTDGTWTNSPSSYAYQWRRCNAAGGACVDIGGAIASSYPLAPADVNGTIRVVVTATNLDGSTPATSSQTATIAGIAPTAGTAATSGTTTAGQTLTASGGGTWTDGVPAAGAYTWQWRRCNAVGATCVDIAGATASTYVLVGADIDSTIRVVASRTNSCAIGCGTASAISPQTAQVAGIPPTAGALTITGIAGNTQVLTSNIGAGWTSGTPVGTDAYQWRRCDSAGAACANITGATSSTYTLVTADIGSTIRVVMTRTNTCTVGCGSASTTSAQTAVVEGIALAAQGPPATANGTAVTVSVPAGIRVGDVLVAQIVVRDGTDQTITPPACGCWTLIRRSNNSTRVALASYYRVVDGSEGAGYSFSWNVSRGATGVILSFSGVNVTTPIDAWSESSGLGFSNVAASATTTVANTRLLALFGERQGLDSYTPPAGMTELSDIPASDVTSEIASQTQVAVGATGTRTATAVTSTDWVAQLVALRPM